MHLDSLDINKNDYSFSLELFEASGLYMFLNEYFCKIEIELKHIVHKKYEKIRYLLHADFGLKSTIWGLKKGVPYKMHDHEVVKEELQELNYFIMSTRIRTSSLYEVYVRLSKLVKHRSVEFPNYEDPSKELEMSRLNFIKDYFENLGISRTIEEYQKIIRHYL